MDEAPQEAAQRETWLAAAWPGMGNVAIGAGAYLVSKLRAGLVHEVPARDMFDVRHIEVEHGLARPGALPRSMFFEWKHPENTRDMLFFIGEAQPTERGYEFCHRLLDYAMKRNLTRVFTFAAMATQLHPTGTPRVFGTATDRPMLAELEEHNVSMLEEGQISGLNGVLLGAASERGLRGACLLGELPYFAVSVPNPKASLVVLEVFNAMAQINVDMSELRGQADASEHALVELLERLQEAARQQGIGEEAMALGEFTGETEEEEEPATPRKSEPKLDYAARQRIEALFDAASKDTGKAFQLKQELDRLGAFKQYEDRFLDLFKKGE
jgi:uncharacterized protein